MEEAKKRRTWNPRASSLLSSFNGLLSFVHALVNSCLIGELGNPHVFKVVLNSVGSTLKDHLSSFVTIESARIRVVEALILS